MPAPIALQLYSIRDAIAEQGLLSIMQTVAEMGYRGVEPYRSLDPVAVAKHAADLDLTITSAHLSPPVGDDRRPTLEMAATLGIDTVIVPYLDPEAFFSSAEGVEGAITLLNAAHAACSAAGLTLAYHNHDFEFVDIDGTSGYELLRAGLDEGILLEIDTYWVQVAGYDAAELVREVGPRSPFLHIKDGPMTDRSAPMVAVGSGAMDIPAVIAASEGHAKWLIVELDHCATDMLDAVRGSYEYLVSNGLAEGR